jgi:hypothetical protein
MTHRTREIERYLTLGVVQGLVSGMVGLCGNRVPGIFGLVPLGAPLRPLHHLALGINWPVGLSLHGHRRNYRCGHRPAAGLAAALGIAGFTLGMESPAPARPVAATAGTAARPNVILIVMDTVRADHLSVFGYKRDTSPNLKNLAADATRYSQALSVADITLSSHASMFTGLHPSWHGAYLLPAPGFRLRPPNRARAHDSRSTGSKWLPYSGRRREPLPTFRFRPAARLSAVPYSPAGSHSGGRVMVHAPQWNARPDRPVGDTSQFDRLYSRGDAVTNEFFDMLSQPNPAQPPFFAFFNYMDAHFPCIPPAPFDRAFPGSACW